jgi:uncharacterized protein YndB with AHSA1/START domain
MLEPLRLEFDVDCGPGQAFGVWTERIGSWWPPSHTVAGEPGSQVVLEGRPGGRIFERTPAGIEHDWGEVVAFEPPARLAYLWHIRRDRADATEVEVRFQPIGEGRTRVEIEHRGWERLGTEAASWRDRNQLAWGSLLPHYRRALAAVD